MQRSRSAALPILLFSILPSARADELELQLDRALQRATGGGFWGVALVASGGKPILSRGYGFADYAQRPNRPETLFELASVSKQFTAAAILRLEQEGKLSTSDPISRFFPSAPQDKRAITLQQLLTHTAGLDPEVGLPYASPAERGEAVKELLRPPLTGKPGQAFAYSNTGYALLAAVVEVASGQPFERYLRQALFQPAGLKDTGCINDEGLDAARASVRLDGPETPAEWTAARWFWGWGYRGMGGVVSTAEDMLRWDRALRGDAILGAAARAKLYRPALEGYACGWEVEQTPRGTTRVSHGGGVLGYATWYARWLEEDVTVVLLSNGKSDLQAAAKAIGDLLFPPPRVRTRLAWKELGEWGSADLPAGAAVSLERAGRELRLAIGPEGGPRAELFLPPDAVAPLLAGLEQALQPTRGPQSDSPTNARMYLRSYEPEGRSELVLETGLELRVMVRYRGTDEAGVGFVDDRPTLVLEDGATGQWPLMVWLRLKDARALRDRLIELR